MKNPRLKNKLKLVSIKKYEKLVEDLGHRAQFIRVTFGGCVSMEGTLLKNRTVVISNDQAVWGLNELGDIVDKLRKTINEQN